MPRRALLSCLLLLTCAPAALAAGDPPVATTGTATAIGQTQATLTASVDPRGTATSVHFELGTTTAYGLQSASKDVGAGTGASKVEIPVQGLTAHTTYHYRVIATSDAGTVQGADASLTTDSVPAAPAKPSISGTTSRSTSRTGTTLVATVNPRGTATSYHFEYGTTTAYGSVAGQGQAGSGSSNVGVSARVEGLRSGTRYHFRLVANSAVGTTNGPDRTVTTRSAPRTATLVGPGSSVTYARSATLTGKLSGPGVSGVPVHLQATAFPFMGPFVTVATVNSSSSGAYSFTLPAVLQTARMRVLSDGNPAAVSSVLVLKSAARVGILHVRRHRRSVRLAGRLAPYSGQGVVSVQRQTASGRWSPLRRTAAKAGGVFGVTVPRFGRPVTIRIVGIPNDGGAHARGVSRTLTIPAILRHR